MSTTNICNETNHTAGEKRSRLLSIYFIIAQLIPNCILCYTESYGIWSNLALLLLPLGFYMLWSMALKRSGIMIWAAFPLTFLCAFQIVLSYLFGNSIIATDMFTNVLTTNPGEATELLSNIYPSVIFVVVLYVPMLWLATLDIRKRHLLPQEWRRKFSRCGIGAFLAGGLLLIPAYMQSEEKAVVRKEIFPTNVIYNLGLSISEYSKTKNFTENTRDFRFGAVRTDSLAEREIYVFVIGEASRAFNWELMGYPKNTNPLLKQVEGLIPFRNILTQSNTTHKSVPLILSSIATDQHEELYRRKGLPELFNEAGFETWFISNQSPQGAMIDNLAHDAQHIIYVGAPRHDMQILDQMQEALKKSRAQKILFVLHCYGSHFSYHQRYPREFARFLPDDDVAISKDHIDYLRNAYDNSVLYTDFFLANTIRFLGSLENTASALLYCADHGEDLLDDKRHRFLHASPTTTAYQLWIASLAWFSEEYKANYPEKVAAAESNTSAPSTTHMMFHTMADIASIDCEYIDPTMSMVNASFDRNAPRYYLNDHNQAKRFVDTGMTSADVEVLKQHGIEL